MLLKVLYDYDSPEMYMMYNRGFGFVGQGTLGYDHTKTETLSPFCNVDFMEFCFGIPLVLRCNRKIYFDWVLRKYQFASIDEIPQNPFQKEKCASHL